MRPPQDPEVLALMGRAIELVGRGRTLQAAELAHEIWQRWQGDKFVEVWAGQVLAKYGERKLAVAVYCESEGLAPGSWEGYWQLGHVLLSWSESGRAVGFLEEAVRIEPRAIDAQLDLARCLSELGRHDEAKARLEQARALDREASL